MLLTEFPTAKITKPIERAAFSQFRAQHCPKGFNFDCNIGAENSKLTGLLDKMGWS